LRILGGISVFKSGVADGDEPHGGVPDRHQLSRLSVGVASVLAASGGAYQAHAQEQPAVELPQVEVTAEKSKPKAKPKKQKKAASSAAVPSAAPASVAAPPTPSEQLGLTPPSGNSLAGGTGLGRLPGTLQDTPQTVNVVSQQQIQQQRITTLDQALKNVPGVTVSIGEGGGGMNGDQFRIRGFQAKSDIYLDGLRDFGVYVRDSFAYEEVQVLKGPSSESFGMGTTGGVINTISKTASLGNFATVDGSIGNGPLYRSTFDINQQIDAHTAFRVYGMINDQDIVDRDHSKSDRWGIGTSVGFGLGTDTTWTVNYFYEHGNRTPDYGVPVIPPSGGGPSITNLAIPITEYAVPRDTVYGKSTDHDIYDVHIATSKLSKQIQPGLTFYNDSRLAFCSRDFASGPAECSTRNPGDPADPRSCLEEFQAGLNPEMALGGHNPGFLQDSWGIQNIAALKAKFNTPGLHHEVVAGIDVFHQEDERTQLAPFDPVTGLPTSRGPTYIRTPVYGASGYYLAPNPYGLGAPDDLANNGRHNAQSSATDVAAFISERVWVSKELSFLGGARYDDYRATYRFWCNKDGQTGGLGTIDAADAPCVADDAWSDKVKADTQFWSPKASVIWEPSKNETYYASWARSVTPAGASVTNDVSSISDPSSSEPGVQIPDPEENESYEIGAKISVLDGKLGFSGALFRVDKSNQTYTDNAGNSYQTGEEVRVQGFELGVSGSITKEWMASVAYAYLDGEVMSGANAGNVAQQVPKNNFSLWTTYEISDLLPIGPGETVIGAGVTYTDGYYIQNTDIGWIPSTFSLDGMISYEYEDWRLALNGNNLTDEINYSSAQSSGMGGRAVVAPGRSFVMTVGKKF
jgi:catecholate siderophore receptor